MATRQRYIRNPETKDVWIYTERLREAYPAFEEVWADSVAEATVKAPMPDPAKVTLEQVEGLSKADLIVFATKLSPPLVLGEDDTIEQMLDLVKPAIFGVPADPTPVAATETPAS